MQGARYLQTVSCCSDLSDCDLTRREFSHTGVSSHDGTVKRREGGGKRADGGADPDGPGLASDIIIFIYDD